MQACRKVLTSGGAAQTVQNFGRFWLTTSIGRFNFFQKSRGGGACAPRPPPPGSGGRDIPQMVSNVDEYFPQKTLTL